MNATVSFKISLTDVSVPAALVDPKFEEREIRIGGLSLEASSEIGDFPYIELFDRVRETFAPVIDSMIAEIAPKAAPESKPYEYDLGERVMITATDGPPKPAKVIDLHPESGMLTLEHATGTITLRLQDVRPMTREELDVHARF